MHVRACRLSLMDEHTNVNILESWTLSNCWRSYTAHFINIRYVMLFNGVNVGPVDINWIDIINFPIFSRVASQALGHRTRASENFVNTLRPRQNGRHFPDDIFKWFCLNENVSVAIKISLNFVPKGPINNIPTLVQIMAWRRPGDRSLSEPMIVSIPMHTCVTRPQWAKLTGNRTQWNSTRRVHNYWKSCSMITSSNRNISALLALCEGKPPVIGGFPSQRPVTRSFGVFFQQTVAQTIEVIWDGIAIIITHYYVTAMM